MTNGISFRPNVQLTFTSPTSGEQVKATSPGQVEGHLTVPSQKALTATFIEKLNCAWLAVLKMLHGPLFNTWENQVSQKKALAIDILVRLNEVDVPCPNGKTEKLGDLVMAWLDKKGIGISFEDDFKKIIELEALPEIARIASHQYYEQYEQQLLSVVKQKGFAIDQSKEGHLVMRSFLQFCVDGEASFAEETGLDSSPLDGLLGNVAKLLDELDKKLSPEERDLALGRIMKGNRHETIDRLHREGGTLLTARLAMIQ